MSTQEFKTIIWKVKSRKQYLSIRWFILSLFIRKNHLIGEYEELLEKKTDILLEI